MSRINNQFLYEPARQLTAQQHNEMKKQQHQSETPDALRSRVIEVRNHLPKIVIPIFVHVFPEYEDAKLKARLQNVLQLRVTDSEIVSKLEYLKKQLTPKK